MEILFVSRSRFDWTTNASRRGLRIRLYKKAVLQIRLLWMQKKYETQFPIIQKSSKSPWKVLIYREVDINTPNGVVLLFKWELLKEKIIVTRDHWPRKFFAKIREYSPNFPGAWKNRNFLEKKIDDQTSFNTNKAIIMAKWWILLLNSTVFMH